MDDKGLLQRLKDRTGEPFLLVEEHVESSHSGSRDSRWLYTDRTTALGHIGDGSEVRVRTQDEIDERNRSNPDIFQMEQNGDEYLLVATEGNRYVERRNNWQTEWRIKQGKLFLQKYDLTHLDNDLEDARRGERSVGLYLGDEVEQYFTAVKRLEERMGELHTNAAERFLAGVKDGEEITDPNYFYAMRLLGKEIPWRHQRQEEEESMRRIVQVVNSLEGQMGILDKNRKEIKAVYEIAAGGDGHRIRNGAMELIGGDAVSAFFATWGYRERAEESRRKAGALLESALHHRFHERGIVLQGNRPGMKIHLAEYLPGLCKQIGLDIHEDEMGNIALQEKPKEVAQTA